MTDHGSLRHAVDVLKRDMQPSGVEDEAYSQIILLRCWIGGPSLIGVEDRDKIMRLDPQDYEAGYSRDVVTEAQASIRGWHDA